MPEFLNYLSIYLLIFSTDWHYNGADLENHDENGQYFVSNRWIDLNTAIHDKEQRMFFPGQKYSFYTGRSVAETKLFRAAKDTMKNPVRVSFDCMYTLAVFNSIHTSK